MSLFRNNRKTLLNCSILAALTAPVCTVAYAATTIEGKVTTSDGSPLAGVRVTVAGTSQSVFTNNQGHYTLRQVGEGQQTLVFEYIGLSKKQHPVQSTDGIQQLDVQFDTEEDIERIQVTSQRDSSNRALNDYRAADAITNFIASDDMGQFVDQNVAESLQRLPGTSISRDQGEGRFVSVRGISPGLNTVTINGVRVGTPEDGSRAVALDVIPTGSVESLSLVKAPTADMPGDAIGGSINIETPSPFDRQGKQVRYRAEASYNDLSGEVSPKLEFNLSDQLSDNFGYAFGINYLDRKLESDNVEAEYDEVDFGNGEVFSIIELQQRKYYVNRERLGSNLNLEYRPDSNSRVYFNTMYSEFTDKETRQRSIFSFEDGDVTEFNGTSARVDLPADSMKRRIRFRTKEQKTMALDIGGENRFENWTLNYRAGYTLTEERVLDENEGRFESTLEGLSSEVSFGEGLPSFRILEGDTLSQRHLDNSNFVLDRAVLEPKLIDDDEVSFGLDAEIPYAFGISSLTLKTGIDVRMKDKDADVNEYEFRDVPDYALDNLTTGSPEYGLGNLGDGISRAAYLDYYYQNAELFAERDQDVAENRALRAGGDFTASEDVYAGYLMGTFDLGHTRVIPGVRVEQTQFEAEGTELLFDEQGELTIGSRFADSDYTNVLPSIHMLHDISSDMRIRGAWTNTIARPSFNDISPRAEIDRDDMEAELGNPELDPYESMNFDLMFDWFYAESSLFTFGGFYKDIDNYIVDTVSNNVDGFTGFQVEQPTNAVSASVKGLEANWQHSFVGSSLEGLLIGANMTLLDTKLELLERSGESFSIPEAADLSGNVYVGYENGPFSTRLSLSHRDESLNEVGDDPRYDIYTAPHTQLDLTASYRISQKAELVFEATNINDEPLELYQGSRDYTLQLEEYGPTFSFGLKGSF